MRGRSCHYALVAHLWYNLPGIAILIIEDEHVITKEAIA